MKRCMHEIVNSFKEKVLVLIDVLVLRILSGIIIMNMC